MMQSKTILRLLHSLCLVAVMAVSKPLFSQVELSPDAQFSILTCSPGNDLYSLFGHTAIRVQDMRNGKIMDLVFNYGTFDFTDDFYVKFAMGKLDYKLSISHFGDFQKSYIDELRGIEEQPLLLNHAQRSHLWELLQANYKPENQAYRYDFFYDNCATRVRDIILLACQLSHDHPLADSISTHPEIDYSQELNRVFPTGDDPSTRASLSNDHSALFTYNYPQAFSFREAIDQYLMYQPWSDFGIDVALGMPCDRKVLPTQAMFLPDSLKLEFMQARAENKPLVGRTEDLLFNENEWVAPRLFTPFWIFSLILIALIAAACARRTHWTHYSVFDRLILITCGLVGLLVTFLWFVTDHHGTVNNLNILWAHPLWLLLAVVRAKSKIAYRLALACGSILVLTILGFAWLPQALHIATMPLMLGCLLICAKIIFAHRKAGYHSQQLVSSL
jgi:hypothetical protein